MTDPVSPQPKTARWVRITLILSLSLNLLIVGLAVGTAVTYRAGKGDMGRGGPLTAALTVEDRQALNQDLRRELRPLLARREARARAQELLGLLRQSPFDAVAFVDLQNRQLGAEQQRREVGQAKLVERVIAMTDAERAAYADRLEQMINRGQRKGPTQRP